MDMTEHTTEQFNTYHLAYHLVHDDKFQILHMDAKQNELWLNKKDKKSSSIIRIIQQGFDWKNHLKKDIASVFHRVEQMKNILSGKSIQIYNVYITEFPPVDSWEILKKPMLLKSKKPLQMNIFYLSDQQFNEEYERLLGMLNSQIKSQPELLPAKEQKQWISLYKYKLSSIMSAHKENLSSIINYGKPKLTNMIILVNIFIFFLLSFNGGSTNIQTLIDFGAKENSLIMNGEWWRIISSAFLHIGIIHLLMNMVALFYLGSIVEKTFGTFRFIIIYFISIIGGSLISFTFHTNVSAGASGAIFGLFGALLFFTIVYKQVFFKTMGKNLLLLLMINIIFGMIFPGIDMGAHIGGLIAGLLTAGMLYVPNKKNFILQFLCGLLIVASIIFFVYFGIQMNSFI